MHEYSAAAAERDDDNDDNADEARSYISHESDNRRADSDVHGAMTWRHDECHDCDVINDSR